MQFKDLPKQIKQDLLNAYPIDCIDITHYIGESVEISAEIKEISTDKWGNFHVSVEISEVSSYDYIETEKSHQLTYFLTFMKGEKHYRKCFK